MKTLLLICIVLLGYSRNILAQRVVIDSQHLTSVLQNASVRSAAEGTHQQYLSNINNNLNDMNANASTVVLAQTVIYQSLSNVNSALKNGAEIKYMTTIIPDIVNYTQKCLDMAKEQPFLLTAANRLTAEMRSHALLLANDVSAFITKEGDNVLADFNSRDELLRKVTQRLQILDGLAYGAWRAMYWARERGIIATLDPFAGYINRDRMYVSQIIANAKYLKP